MDQYTLLKEEIVKYVGSDVDFTPVKEYLSSYISKRTLSRIRSTEYLIRHLEELDCVNPGDVSLLENLESLFGREVLNLIRTYKKLRGLHKPGFSNVFPSERVQQEILPITGDSQKSPFIFEKHFLENRPADLVRAIHALSCKLHNLWPVLMRELGLQEGYIRSLRQMFHENYQQQALRALDYWSINDSEASVQKLCNALSRSECRRRGLSPQLTEFEPFVRMLV